MNTTPHQSTDFSPQVVNRGKFGYAVVWHIDGQRFESAMPDEATALLTATSQKLLIASEAVIDSWEKGDLAAAVRYLSACIKEARP